MTLLHGAIELITGLTPSEKSSVQPSQPIQPFKKYSIQIMIPSLPMHEVFR
jgi:hypothetical protein